MEVQSFNLLPTESKRSVLGVVPSPDAQDKVLVTVHSKGVYLFDVCPITHHTDIDSSLVIWSKVPQELALVSRKYVCCRRQIPWSQSSLLLYPRWQAYTFMARTRCGYQKSYKKRGLYNLSFWTSYTLVQGTWSDLRYICRQSIW